MLTVGLQYLLISFAWRPSHHLPAFPLTGAAPTVPDGPGDMLCQCPGNGYNCTVNCTDKIKQPRRTLF